MMHCDRRGRHLQRRPLGASEDQRASLKKQQSRVLALWTEDKLGRGLPTRQTDVNPTKPQKLRAWQQRAPQGRAPSDSAGKRRALVSWIRLPSSLEETRRKGARVPSGVTSPPHPSSPPLAAGPMKMLWCISSGASCPLLVLNPGGETPWAWPRRRAPRAQSRRSGDAKTKAHCPGSSTCEALPRDQVKASPVHPQNAGAPSSKDQTADPTPTGRDEGGERAADSQPEEKLTH